MKYKPKYGNRKVEVEGIAFDSKREANRYSELKLLQRAGMIKDLQMHVRFELIPKQDGERACVYIADFVYTGSDGKIVVEDAKGYKGGGAYTVFTIKRKLMLQRFGIRIKEV